MPFALAFIGIILTISALQGTQDTLGTLLKNDLLGKQSYLWWAFAILVVGMIGYVKALKGFADLFLALILIALFLHNSSVFENAISGIGQATTKPVQLASDNLATSSVSNASVAGSASSIGGAVAAGGTKLSGGGIEGVAAGAASGAAMGAVAGPWGAAAGAVVGGILGGIG